MGAGAPARPRQPRLPPPPVPARRGQRLGVRTRRRDGASEGGRAADRLGDRSSAFGGGRGTRESSAPSRNSCARRSDRGELSEVLADWRQDSLRAVPLLSEPQHAGPFAGVRRFCAKGRGGAGKERGTCTACRRPGQAKVGLFSDVQRLFNSILIRDATGNSANGPYERPV